MKNHTPTLDLTCTCAIGLTLNIKIRDTGQSAEDIIEECNGMAYDVMHYIVQTGKIEGITIVDGDVSMAEPNDETQELIDNLKQKQDEESDAIDDECGKGWEER